MNKTPLNPTIIHLKELPEEGKTYLYTQETGEIHQTLVDLVGQAPYKVELTVAPLGNAYEVRGHISTSLDLVCSRCAADFSYPLNEKIHEILVIEEARPRKGRSAKANHHSEFQQDGPFCNYLPDHDLKVGPFAHELIASLEPMQPLGQSFCLEPNPPCENYQKAVNEGWINQPESEEKPSPFAALKNLKI